MTSVQKRVLDPTRLRRLPKSGFGWIDRRFVNGGFLAALTSTESQLYFFLASVADQDGLSFFGDRRVGGLLKLADHQLHSARSGLERKDLILFRSPLYQVLSLPSAPDHGDLCAVTMPHPASPALPNETMNAPRSLGAILRSRPPSDP
jgi:hypothetical protein